MTPLAATISIIVLSSAPADTASWSRLAERKAGVSGNCPDKWFDASFVDMGCLFFNNTAAVTWEEANVICHKYSNSSLVEIQSEMQMNFLKMELDAIASAEDVSRLWWTAGTDIGFEGQWIWITSLTKVEDYVWHPGHPRLNINGSISISNCLSLRPRDYDGYDIGCENRDNPICQLK